MQRRFAILVGLLLAVVFITAFIMATEFYWMKVDADRIARIEARHEPSSDQGIVGHISPSKACAFLEDFGLKTGEWNERSYRRYGCISSRRDVSAETWPATLAYSVTGTEETVTDFKLDLSVHDGVNATGAHHTLREAAEALSMKVSGSALPPTIAESIDAGKGQSPSDVGGAIVVVERDNWRSGRGYQIQVTFR